MKAFKATFGAYVVEQDRPAALRRFELVRAICISKGVDPGVARVEVMSDEEITRIPGLSRLVERMTRPQHGPCASDEEREEALRAIAKANGGDAGVASAILHSIERAQGYLPRNVALALIQKFSTAATTTQGPKALAA